MSTIAVIQPYFFPYAGYFRLFSAADTLVFFDCVQFPRRGWVHRNRFASATGEPEWLTLPLVKAPRDVRIADLRFPPDAPSRLADSLHRFPLLEQAARDRNELIGEMLRIEGDDVTAYLCHTATNVAATLGFSPRILRSSALGIDPALRGQERVVAIVSALGGKTYVNPSGGRELYDSNDFERAGIALRFLTPYGASMESIMGRLLGESPERVAEEIRRETQLAK